MIKKLWCCNGGVKVWMFGFINRVDEGNLAAVKRFECWRFEHYSVPGPSWIDADKGVTLKTSTLESLYDARPNYLKLSRTLLIKPSILLFVYFLQSLFFCLKVDGKTLCLLCTLSYKRILHKAKKGEKRTIEPDQHKKDRYVCEIQALNWPF